MAKKKQKRKTAASRAKPASKTRSRSVVAKKRAAAPRRASTAKRQPVRSRRAVERVRADLDLVFDELKQMLAQYGSALRVQADKAGTYYLNALREDVAEKPYFFGGARQGKNYVSLYLMPVYEFADLMSNVPADLRKRMQGKSCFNFRTLAEVPREELRRLIDAAVARVKAVAPASA